MVSNLITELDLDADYLYPDSDGKPMADNTEQYQWIVKIKENLEILFRNNPDVFIAGDLLWYPLKSTLVNPCAPDVMVVFGRNKGYRGSYKQWQEDDIPPQVVFEILSPKNTKSEMSRKLEFYQMYGVQEYYVYDPLKKIAQGWQKEENKLVQIKPFNDHKSELLGIIFKIENAELEIYYPNGDRFLNSVELAENLESEKQRANLENQRANLESQRADSESQRADSESQRAQEAELIAQLEKQRAQEAELIAQLEKQRADKLAQKLRELGINPDQL